MEASQMGVVEGKASSRAESQTGGYAAEWKSYARRRYLALFLLFGALPFTFAAVLNASLSEREPLWSVAAILLWWVLTCVAIWWAGEFRCPRCSRRFGALGSRKGFSTIWRGLFDRICGNCKLRRWEQG